jgi:uncharacterized SAM-binding protein YcdF (DUF218 family)
VPPSKTREWLFINVHKMKPREIERSPVPPKLNHQTIQLLTKLCFRPDDELEKADLIFAFSSTTEIEKFAQTIKNLVNQNISKKVFIAGGVPNFHDSLKIPKAESSIVLELIKTTGYPDVEFFTESKSTNTLENVTESLKVLDFRNYKKIVFVFKKHDSRRAYLTLKKFLPNAKLIQQTFTPTYPNTDRPLNKDTWSTYDFGRSRVWGEYLRIKLYGQRGDIAYDAETKTLIEEIEKSII